MNQCLKQVTECTQPWYVRLRRENSIQYNRVVLWALFEEGETGERFRYASPMILSDGVPTEATALDRFDGTEYCPGFTDDVVELPR